MKNLLYTALSEKIDRKLKEQLESQVSSSFDTLKDNLETKVENVIAGSEEIRKTLDKYLDGVRLRVRHVMNEDSSSPVSDGEEEEDSNESRLPTPSEIRIKKLNTEIEKIRDDLFALDCRVVQTEQYPRRESLVFNGIPASIPQKDLEFTVFHVLENLGFDKLHNDDIFAVHRLWSSPESRDPSPVIVKFFNRKIVQWALSHQENLRKVESAMGLKLTMSESLCAKNAESYKICKWLKDQGTIHNYFLRNGFPKVVVHAGDRTMKISHPEILRRKFAGIPTFANT